jgi:proprotein convertase subtilisin/kexin type 5
MQYDVKFNNSLWSASYSFNASFCISNCSASSSVCIDKGSLDIASIILNSNELTFIVSNASIGISELLIIANRCGGIQGGACLECSSTSTCTKCVNSNYYISGYTCVISCPASYYVRTATKTCLSQCVAGTYTDNIQLLCVECQSPCLTCTSNSSCLTCVSNTYLYQEDCLSSCPEGYFANSMRRTCDICIRPCLTCLSNLQCLSCIYGFYNNITHSCVLKCSAQYYGDLESVQCQSCVNPCLTCNSNIGNKCLSCVNGTYLYSFECLDICPSGYYEDLSVCSPCDFSCSTCSISPINCTSCPIGAYLSNSTCITSCPDHFYADSVINLCISCPDNCSTCINA